MRPSTGHERQDCSVPRHTLIVDGYVVTYKPWVGRSSRTWNPGRRSPGSAHTHAQHKGAMSRFSESMRSSPGAGRGCSAVALAVQEAGILPGESLAQASKTNKGAPSTHSMQQRNTFLQECTVKLTAAQTSHQGMRTDGSMLTRCIKTGRVGASWSMPGREELNFPPPSKSTFDPKPASTSVPPIWKLRGEWTGGRSFKGLAARVPL